MLARTRACLFPACWRCGRTLLAIRSVISDRGTENVLSTLFQFDAGSMLEAMLYDMIDFVSPLWTQCPLGQHPHHLLVGWHLRTT
jgi:hypothetical protein